MLSCFKNEFIILSSGKLLFVDSLVKIMKADDVRLRRKCLLNFIYKYRRGINCTRSVDRFVRLSVSHLFFRPELQRHNVR